jgi:hypothetical protein
VVATTAAATRVALTFHRPLTLTATVTFAIAAWVLVLAEDRSAAWTSLRRLAPLIAFSAATVLTIAISLQRTPPELHLVPRVVGPVSWVAAALLGYFAGGRRGGALGVALASVWISLAAGALDFANHAGWHTALGTWYAQWSTAAGAWAPTVSERFRTVGLDIDPNHYGLIGAVALPFALTLRGSPRARAFLALGATLVVATSGSRTAGLAALAGTLVWLVASLTATERRQRFTDSLPALAGVGAAVALVLALSLATGAPSALLDRLGQSGQTLESAGTSQSAFSAVNSAINGRLELWQRALGWYERYPLGAFVPSEMLVGRSVHNEFIDRLLWGGPLLLGAFLFVLGWLAVRVRPPDAPAFGPAHCGVYVAAALMLGPSMQGAFAAMGFYLVGWACSRLAEKPAANS